MMRKGLALLAVLVVAGVVAAGQSGPALNGVWKPDTSKGSFKMVRLDMRLTVKQEDGVVVFEEGSMGAPPFQTLRYRVGVESENTYPGGRSEKATATWENGRLIVKGAREMGVQRTPRPFTLVASVSPDDRELQLEERMELGSSTSSSIRVYTREK